VIMCLTCFSVRYVSFVVCFMEPVLILKYKDDHLNPKMKSIVFDFTYLNMPQKFESRINADSALVDADHECNERYTEILERFYLLFESVWKYSVDYNTFISDLISGFYIQHSVEGLLSDTTGKQLLCEALYLFGKHSF